MEIGADPGFDKALLGQQPGAIDQFDPSFALAVGNPEMGTNTLIAPYPDLIVLPETEILLLLAKKQTCDPLYGSSHSDGS
jgi:hypothetical protein